MSVRQDAPTTAVQPAAPAPSIADPAPLGLAGFALTMFLLSAANAKWMNSATGVSWLGYALAYGGVAQLLAGMWEFRRGNVFCSTAFSSYGGFWIGLGLWYLLVAQRPPSGVSPTAWAAASGKDLGWILLAFAIFNTYMLILSAQVNAAVFGVFLTLEVTEILLFIGGFAASTGWVQAGGYLGVLTALVAWYASAAGVANGIGGAKLRLPVGKPLLT